MKFKGLYKRIERRCFVLLSAGGQTLIYVQAAATRSPLVAQAVEDEQVLS